MNIKKRITLSNIMMLLIPTILILVIAATMYISYMKLFAESENELMREYRNTYQAKQEIKSAANKMTYAHNPNKIAEVQEELSRELLAKGYYLQIKDQEGILYTNLTADCMELLDTNDLQGPMMPDFFVLELSEASVIQNRCIINNIEYHVTAINPEYVPFDIDLGDRIEMIYGYVAIILIMSMFIILVTNRIITSRLAKSLIVPLDLLSYGAGQIKDGNLDFEIRYSEQDEFGQVCADFNEMRLRLKDSVAAQLAYEEDKKELIAGISHDLRTPLTAIKGYVKGIQDKVANTPEKQNHYLDIIYTQTCNMDALVDKLFLFSKLETGHFPFNFERDDFDTYLSGFFKDADEKFATSKLTVTYKNHCSDKEYVRFDKGEMSRVLTNILENSIKHKTREQIHVNANLYSKSQIGDAYMQQQPAYTQHPAYTQQLGQHPDQRPTDSANHIRHSELQIGDAGLQHPTDTPLSVDQVILEIADDGDGVDPRILPHLFKTFYRADPSRTDSSKSSGLGLSIAERIITKHGGTIKAENRNGLCIIITLPTIKEGAN